MSGMQPISGAPALRPSAFFLNKSKMFELFWEGS